MNPCQLSRCPGLGHIQVEITAMAQVDAKLIMYSGHKHSNALSNIAAIFTRLLNASIKPTTQD